MGALVDALQSFENTLDAWLIEATPVPGEIDKLSPAQLADLERLRALREDVQGDLLNLIAAELRIPASALGAAQRQLDAASAELKGLAKDIATLSSVLTIAGTVLSIAGSVLAAALPIL